MAAHPVAASSHKSPDVKIKPHFSFDAKDVKGLSNPSIDTKVTLILKGRVDHLSKDKFGSEKPETRVGIEIDSIESTGHLSDHNSSHGGLPGHKA